jgi:hypothetical protein
MDKLNLYKITQSANDDYDSYDSAIVAATSEEKAKLIHPSNWTNKNQPEWYEDDNEIKAVHDWTTPDNVQVELIGVVTNDKIKNGDVVVASFNAG